ncbi:WXG100 family type VII secretion target OS=Tsukamurella paurometabola (strain ATCC 8368 / DSM/ CCUG 35730 / CIP 100753 / JCM 10117 / KCTC 9821 / NBRC 16120/ NCIMB 702349 / NCTC 13040) OX=521096 GN=Tpau_0329 PE=4 SV=1 [Tsukamurella paurometabola]|uniref:Uncharacterized protein n=1 Tax=Tsukamurella paurometabola (strain ATCC 8368 / DSM 20162 / CCUG 35730 / CIP 100753 / JCM 10117 / KCTC 9821 / NBRC 16120 / NCIMB 702349 / NCTC 13040) TaxID=521096 RepID=D5URB9_TSUPD|nr:hypothetical protein [Tsukamurella paurometabola]ADG76972.1 hypothetical protein Tpau_0329 [Tsukamurella paurometabola DSM 20162]SUP42348.1 Uncharacterised protein [Tsukamurella paurometabola]
MPIDLIKVDYANYDTTSTLLGKSAAIADGLIAELVGNNTANLNAGNWVGPDQGSYQDVHNACVEANERLAEVIRKAGIKVQTAATIHQAGQAQAASLYF